MYTDINIIFVLYEFEYFYFKIWMDSTKSLKIFYQKYNYNQLNI